MMSSTADLSTLAGEAFAAFETRTRDPRVTGSDSSQFVTLKDDAPVWVQPIVQTAHGDMLPDDWRYATICEAFGEIHDAGEGVDLDDLEHEFADRVDVYTSELLAWLSSNLTRMGYCDDAQAEGLVESDAGISQRITIGQYMERREVFGLVLQALREHAESL